MPDVLGIIGSGDVTETNAAALLDNFLPEGDIFGIYTTERVTRGQAGLRRALTWMENEDLEIDRVADVVGNLGAHLAKKHVPVLIVVGTEGVEGEIGQAHAMGIQVVDLTRALDDVLPADPQDMDGDKAAEGTYGPPSTDRLTDAEVLVLKRFAQFLMDSSPAADTPPFNPPYTEAEAGTKPKAAVKKAPAQPAAATTRKDGDKPYFVTEDGSIRPARGRKAADETKVFLSEDEAAHYVEVNGEPPF